jgi:hypothetical protein
MLATRGHPIGNRSLIKFSELLKQKATNTNTRTNDKWLRKTLSH